MTLNENGDKRGTHRKYLSYAFTEQGVNMLATVLKGEIAVKQSIAIMRAFRKMRHYIQQNLQFVTQNELKALKDTIDEDSRRINARQDETDSRIEAINESIQKIFLLKKRSESSKLYSISSD